MRVTKIPTCAAYQAVFFLAEMLSIYFTSFETSHNGKWHY